MEPVHILLGQDGAQDNLLVDLTGQRQLHQDAVHRPVLVQALDHIQQLLLGGLLRHFDDLGLDAHFPTGLVFVAHINL